VTARSLDKMLVVRGRLLASCFLLVFYIMKLIRVFFPPDVFAFLFSKSRKGLKSKV
jgi:hypothetical protein